jgi:hypothetical protein
VAIIGILVTLLLPSLRKARQKARVAICASNLKQTSYAWLMYANTNDGRTFNYVSYEPGHLQGNGIGHLWTEYLKEFLDSPQVLLCPETFAVDDNPGSIVMGKVTSAWREGRYETVGHGIKQAMHLMAASTLSILMQTKEAMIHIKQLQESLNLIRLQ